MKQYIIIILCILAGKYIELPIWQRNPKAWEFWMYRCCTDKETGEKYGWGRVLDYIGIEWEDIPPVQMTIFDFPEYLPEEKRRN